MAVVARNLNKAPLYAEIEPQLKARLSHLATVRRRKLTAELEMAIERYLEVEEAKEGIVIPEAQSERPVAEKPKRARKPKTDGSN